MRPSEVAYRAADVIAERGHCKHNLQDERGRVCLNGAVNVAAYGDAFLETPSTWRKIGGVIRDIMIAEGRDSDCGPVSWNDEPDVTGEDVILMLKKAAARLEESGR